MASLRAISRRKCHLSGNDVCSLLLVADREFLRFKMAGTAVALQLISFLFCCGRCLVESDSEPERFPSAALT